MRILLVEDDLPLASSIQRTLEAQGWFVDHTARGEPVVTSLKADPYDVVVLDIGLAGIDGFETLRRVRAEKLDTPVLMLTARDAVEDRVRGLESGADDYLVKPFAPSELIARLRVLTRRAQARSSERFELGALTMDLLAKRAFLGGEELELSVREWSVLEFLLGKVGKVVSKDDILQAIVGWDEAMTENAIEVYVSRLRVKLADSGVQIRTVRGFGYMLEDGAAAGAADAKKP